MYGVVLDRRMPIRRAVYLFLSTCKEQKHCSEEIRGFLTAQIDDKFHSFGDNRYHVVTIGKMKGMVTYYHDYTKAFWYTPFFDKSSVFSRPTTGDCRGQESSSKRSQPSPTNARNRPPQETDKASSRQRNLRAHARGWLLENTTTTETDARTHRMTPSLWPTPNWIINRRTQPHSPTRRIRGFQDRDPYETCLHKPFRSRVLTAVLQSLPDTFAVINNNLRSYSDSDCCLFTWLSSIS